MALALNELALLTSLASMHAMRHAKFYHRRVSKLAQLGGKTAELATLTQASATGVGRGVEHCGGEATVARPL